MGLFWRREKCLAPAGKLTPDSSARCPVTILTALSGPSLQGDGEYTEMLPFFVEIVVCSDRDKQIKKKRSPATGRGGPRGSG